VGGNLSQQQGFNCALGYLQSNEVRPGVLPHCLNGWCWGDGRQWHSDETISIREVTQLPQQYTELEQQIQSNLCKAECWKTKELTEDGPGQYVIAHDKAAVTADADVSACSPTLACLARGTHVSVVEVRQFHTGGRLRARISSPSGWISLAHVENNYRWAYRQDDVLRHGGLCAVTKASLRRCCSSASTENGTEVTGASGSSWSPTSSRSPTSSEGIAEASRPASSAQPSIPSDNGSRTLGRHLMPAADTPLRALRVMSPNGQGECAGIYVLIAAEMPNGQPVWEQSASVGHLLFSGKNGR